MIQRTSLSQTLDAVNEAAFFQRKIARSEAKATADWIAARHCVPGTYARMFGLFPDERANGFRLFTGERITNAAARHIAGEEACRALLLLNANSAAAREALRDATADMVQRLGPADAAGPRPDDGQMHWLWPYRGGTYCCGACSVSLWRHITAGGLDDAQRRLERGMECLKTCRKGDGTWRIFPFWYTLSSLVEMDVKPAIEEMRFAARRCESAARRSSTQKYAQRRIELAKRVLAKV
jgi:hypothetical protein